MENYNPVKTPLEDMKLKKSPRTNKPCRELLGCLMYAAVATRPDLSTSISFLSRYQQSKPTEVLWQRLKRVLRYVKGTLDYGLHFRSNERDLVAYSDADFGGSVDCKSTSGQLIKIYG